ncbi:MAG: cell division protein SepF [Eubacterium sp.]|jgi:cell division inhibitor SepF|nr:cell division protein SepF [Eubacterium sp.]
MGVFDKFKDLVGIGDDYEEDEEITEEEIEAAESKMEREQERQRFSRQSSSRGSNVVPMGGVMNEAMKLVVIEPASFEESPKLVDSLKSRKPVILNLENLDSETARKIFDFISGATYALNGSVQKVANNIFVFAPENVDISANENREFDFSSMDNNTWR